MASKNTPEYVDHQETDKKNANQKRLVKGLYIIHIFGFLSGAFFVFALDSYINGNYGWAILNTILCIGFAPPPNPSRLISMIGRTIK